MIRLILLGLLLSSTFVSKTNAQLINAGVSGNSTTDLLNRIDKDVLAHRPELVILMVGTNDLLNSKKIINYSSYQSNLNQIIKKLKSEEIKVLVMSSPPVDSAYLFRRHDRNLYLAAPNQILDSASQIVRKVAMENDALFLNLFEKFSELGLPKHNEDLFFRNQMNSGTKDGVHPTALGYHFIAEQVFQFLKHQKLVHKDLKIICFGDSITFGAGVDKSKNYPTYLTHLLAH
ncbi:MAG: hypothetical protein Sapg2KO_25620 [Saprospiraceae bacterium]